MTDKEAIEAMKAAGPFLLDADRYRYLRENLDLLAHSVAVKFKNPRSLDAIIDNAMCHRDPSSESADE